MAPNGTLTNNAVPTVFGRFLRRIDFIKRKTQKQLTGCIRFGKNFCVFRLFAIKQSHFPFTSSPFFILLETKDASPYGYAALTNIG